MKEKILFIITIVIISVVMLFWIGQKEGFHEDEIFSYGSSNYKYDNVFQRYGPKDEVNQIIFDEILKENTIEQTIYYLKNPDQFMEKYETKVEQEVPVWKTREDAKQYLTIGKDDIFNYASVYYNQSRDVHPPLFYFTVHLVSTIFFGVFSKYIIFTINLIFLILSFIVIRKILIILDKKYLTIPIIILYGLSIGSISIMMFLRMYQMLTFFVLLSLYIHIKIIKNDFEIDKKNRNALMITTICGFLTQYYFCIFAFFEFIIFIIILIKNKKYDNLKKYIKYHIISAIIGIIIFPASIYHIFFSYRGMGAELETNFVERMIMYFKEMCYSFSISEKIGLIIIVALIIGYIFTKNKYINIIVIPTLASYLIICLIAPQMANTTIIRYIAFIIPLFSLIVILISEGILNKIIKNKKIITTALTIIVSLLSIYGLITSEPRFLIKGYDEILETAKENKDSKLISIWDNNFTYISSLPEFLIYEKTLIINANQDSLEILKDDTEIQDEVIVSIKKWLNYNEIINKIMDYTELNHCEMIKDSDELQTIIYKLERSQL